METKQQKARGQKLHKNKHLEMEVAKWIKLENISTYEIVKRLEEIHNFKIAPQSIESWKENYLDEIVKDIKDYSNYSDESNLEKLNILLELKNLIRIIDERVSILTSVADKKSTRDNEGKISYVNNESEKLLKEYIETAISTREKILRYSPDFNIADVIRDVIKHVATVVFLVFNSDIDKTLYPKFKSELVDAEKRLREQYLIKESK